MTASVILGSGAVRYSLKASPYPASDLAAMAYRSLRQNLPEDFPAPALCVYAGPHPLVCPEPAHACWLPAALGIDGLSIIPVGPSSMAGSIALHTAVNLAQGHPDSPILVLGASRFTNLFLGEDGPELVASFLERTMLSLQEQTLYPSWVTPFALRTEGLFGSGGYERTLLGQVVAKSNAASAKNPLAGFTLEPGAKPQETGSGKSGSLGVTDIAPLTDGAVAMLIGPRHLHPKPSLAVEVAGIGSAAAVPSELFHGGDEHFPVTPKALTRALINAAMGGAPEFGHCEVDDRVSSLEIMACEDLGLCGPGEYASLLERDTLRVNESGGHLGLGMGGGAHGLGKAHWLANALPGSGKSGLLQEMDGLGTAAAVTLLQPAS